MGLGLTVAVFATIAIFVYAVAVFLAIALTILSVIAWQRPVRAFGKTVCTPLEARMFIGSGVLGAVGVCAFAVLCTILFDAQIKDDWWFYLITGGYSFVSIAVMMNLAEQYPEGFPNDPYHYGPVIEHDPAPVPKIPPPSAPVPFQYASWDDEADRKPKKAQCGRCAMSAAFPRDPSRPVLRR